MRCSLVIALFTCLFLLPLAAMAADWPALDRAPTIEKTGEGDVALLIGIEDYLLLPDVPGALDNVRDWEVFLRDGLGVSDVVMLRNNEAVREEILAAAERVRDRAQPDSTVWVVFVGHGAPAPDGEDGVLVGADGQQTVNSLSTRSVPQSELADLLSQGQQARTLMIIDACFSGRDFSGEALAKGVQPVVAVETLDVPPNVTLFTAARATEFAGTLPGTERPAFSYLMLGAARGWADDGGDGEVTAEEAVRFARAELADVVGRQQTPQLHGVRDVVLSRGADEEPPRRQRGISSDPAAVDDTATGPSEVTQVHWGGSNRLVNQRVESDAPITDDFGYLKLHVSLVGTDGFSDLGPGVWLTPGFKVLKGHRIDLRLGSWLGLHTQANGRAPSEGSTFNDPTFGADERMTVEAQRMTWLTLGAGPGTAFRLSHVGGGLDRLVYLDSALGMTAVAGGECTSWSDDYFSKCTDRASRTDFFVGGRLGGEFPVLDVAAFLMHKPAELETVFGIAIGLSFDR